ncbi:hypothetical protein ASPWEDRAFT_37552, partial [Aspergillus wentii DTO 134E9]
MALSIESILQLISILLALPQTIQAIREPMTHLFQRATRRDETDLPTSTPRPEPSNAPWTAPQEPSADADRTFRYSV